MAFNPNEHMMKLKGKDYLQVMWRLVWFREEKPLWSIDTAMQEADADHAVFKAVICDENGLIKSTGHGSESKKDFGDFLEKAETKAVGRALAMLGYGTQFSPELDEGERIVDSPVNRSSGSVEAAQAAGNKKLEELNAKLAEAGNGPIKAVQSGFTCERCGKVVKPVRFNDGTVLKVSEILDTSRKDFGGNYCYQCYLDLGDAKNGGSH